MEITQEMIDQSAQEEQALMAESPGMLMAQIQHLNHRVVVLRALVNEQQKELDRLTSLNSDEDASVEQE